MRGVGGKRRSSLATWLLPQARHSGGPCSGGLHSPNPPSQPATADKCSQEQWLRAVCLSTAPGTRGREEEQSPPPCGLGPVRLSPKPARWRCLHGEGLHSSPSCHWFPEQQTAMCPQLPNWEPAHLGGSNVVGGSIPPSQPLLTANSW